MQERRKEPRQRVLKSGKIVHNARSSIYDCRIRDLSQHGARLRMENTWLVPRYFDFVDSTRPDIRRPASIVWREMSEIGIHFEDAA